jgi:hypothetical protein
LAFWKHAARAAAAFIFAASAGIATPTSGTALAKAKRDFVLNMLTSLSKVLLI